MHIDTFGVISIGQISACIYTKHQNRPKRPSYVIRIISYIGKVGGVRGESSSPWVALALCGLLFATVVLIVRLCLCVWLVFYLL